jgi:Type II secretion system (T2SS), protein M subtype b
MMQRWRWRVERTLRAVGLPGWVGAALAVTCAGLWLGVTRPMVEDTRRLVDQTRLLDQRRASLPRLDAAAGTPREQLEAFPGRFGDDKSLTPALKRLHAIARKSGVQIEQAEFKLNHEAGEPLARYAMVLPVKGDYAALRRFMRDALRELPGLALEEVQLRRPDSKAPALETQLRFTLFVSRRG